MRLTAVLLCLAAFVPLCGCESGGKRFVFGPAAAPPSPAGLPSVESLVEYLNDNSNRIQSLRCTDVDVEATQKLQSYGLRAKMMSMKPRNFLMRADALGSSVVDLGSNSEEFWFWFSKAPDPYQYYCSYKDFEDGKVARFPFPFQPDWIMEALGMGTYGPASKYTVEPDGSLIKLVEKTRTPQGQAVRKVIVLNPSARPEQNGAPTVQKYILLDDSTGKEICSAKVLDVMVDRGDANRPGTGAIVPRRLELAVPAESARLRIAFSGLQVNPQLDPSVFQRPTLKDVQSFDLARGFAK